MSHSTQLARWLYKRLSHNYINASYAVPYKEWLFTIKRDSNLLEYSRPNDVTRKFEKALNELIENNVLLSFEKIEEKRGARNKILDTRYSLLPHPDFVKDIKAANKRQKDAIIKISQKNRIKKVKSIWSILPNFMNRRYRSQLDKKR